NKVVEWLWEHLGRREEGNRINTSGDPDPNGPIELKPRQLSSPQPNQIVLMIGGTYHTNRDDVKYVDFTVVYTDTLIADGRSFIRCDSKSEVKIDESGINAWKDALSALIAFLVPFPFVVGAESAARADFERKVRNEISKA